MSTSVLYQISTSFHVCSSTQRRDLKTVRSPLSFKMFDFTSLASLRVRVDDVSHRSIWNVSRHVLCFASVLFHENVCMVAIALEVIDFLYDVQHVLQMRFQIAWSENSNRMELHYGSLLSYNYLCQLLNSRAKNCQFIIAINYGKSDSKRKTGSDLLNKLKFENI